jgi:hypothetical protein
MPLAPDDKAHVNLLNAIACLLQSSSYRGSDYSRSPSLIPLFISQTTMRLARSRFDLLPPVVNGCFEAAKIGMSLRS